VVGLVAVTYRIHAGERPAEVALRDLNLVVRAHWDHDLDEVAARERYGARRTAVELVDDPGQADAVVLPTFWSRTVLDEAHRLAAVARDADRPFVIFGDLDPEPLVPIASALLLHPGLHRSTVRPSMAAALPVTCADRLALRGGLTVRPKPDRPVVGFCGQGAATLASRARRTATVAAARLAHRRGRLAEVPPPWRSHVALRARALDALRRHPGIEDRFAVRDRYRAGVRGTADLAAHPTTIEFDRNVAETDYTLCVRGTGNFSVRFYEALSFGRVPVLVDTDSMLPFEHRIAWDDLIVRIDASQVDDLPELLAEHHRAIGPDRFEARQRELRATWEEWLSVDGCYSHLRELIGDATLDAAPGPSSPAPR
jgi:hypothetical protein